MNDPATLLSEAKRRLGTGDAAGAALLLQSVIAAEPGNARALVLLGIVRERIGDAEAAERCLKQALTLDSLSDPQRAEALIHLGRILGRLRQSDEALGVFQQAVDLQPDSVRPLRSLADALHGARRAGEALPLYEKALALDGSDWRTLNNLALALLTLERPAEAENHLRAAVEAAPAEIMCLTNLGESLLRQFRASDAVTVFEQATTMNPDNPIARGGHARAMAADGRLDDAEAAARQLPAGFPFPGAETAYVAWQLQRFAACDWRDFDATLERIRALTLAALAEERVPALKPLAALECFPGDTALCNAIAKAWSAATRKHTGSTQTPPVPDSDERIRIGYASPDFRIHPVAFLLRDLFAHHDRQRFEIFAYALQAPDDSQLTCAIRETADHFTDLSAHDDGESARRIRADGLHLLVDAAGYTAEARPAVFAFRPAPVQVSYLGFFGSLQADWIDYLVANGTLVPAGSEKDYSETLIRIEPIPFASGGFGAVGNASRAEHGLPDDAIVLACFHRNGKLDPVVFKAWIRILEDARSTVLWLRGDTVLQRDNLRARARDAGIDVERVIFAPHVPFEEHVARHRLADLALDVPGFGGFNTNAIALWCGVPLLTTPGEGFASRVGSAAMQACGLGDAVATDMDDYVNRAVTWCGDPDQLGKLKAAVAGAKDSPLFDGAATTARVEKAWLAIVERAAAGRAPAPVTIKD
jgi:protein O-GlcNAc transferase